MFVSVCAVYIPCDCDCLIERAAKQRVMRREKAAERKREIENERERRWRTDNK